MEIFYIDSSAEPIDRYIKDNHRNRKEIKGDREPSTVSVRGKETESLKKVSLVGAFRTERYGMLRFALRLVLTCAAVAGGIALSGFSPGKPFPLWMWLPAAMCCYTSLRCREMRKCREKNAALAFSFLLILTQLVGRQFDFQAPDGTLSFGEQVKVLYCALCACGLSPALGWPATLLIKKMIGITEAPSSVPTENRKFGVGSVALLMLMWLNYME